MDPRQIGENYDQIAEQWHRDIEHSKYGMPLVRRALQYCTNPKTALDVGCGSGGRVIRLLEEHQLQITGVDVSNEMLKIAQKLHPTAQFYHKDISEWDTDQSFDLIIAWDSIFHLPLARHRPVLSSLCRMLQQDGIFIYTLGSGKGTHIGTMHGLSFGYSTLGIDENLKIIQSSGCQVQHLEFDQYPNNHLAIIVKKL